jgi:flagellar hook-basal body protein
MNGDEDMTIYNSLAGLNAASFQLETTSNNVANVETTGFKKSRASFESIYVSTLQQSQKIQEGQGLSNAELKRDFQQGQIVTSGNQLDLAILGNGFLPVKSATGPQEMYSRNGALQLSAERYVTNSDGDFLRVATIDPLSGQTSNILKTLQLPTQTVGQFKPSTQIKLLSNLSNSQKMISVPFNKDNPSTYSYKNIINFIDDAGVARQGELFLTRKTAADRLNPVSDWQSVLLVDGKEITPEPRNYLQSDTPLKVTGAEFIEWSGNGAKSDIIKLNGGQQASVSLDALSLVGDKVFRGTGTGTVLIGEVDAQKNGKNGNPLRVNLTPSGFTNNSFDTVDTSGALKGWTVLKSQVKLDGSSMIAGFPTPVDLTKPSSSPGDNVSVTNASFRASQGVQGSLGGKNSAELFSAGEVDKRFGVLHGPTIVSNDAVSLKAGSDISFDWRASGGVDAYDVYAYLLNVDTGETTKLLDETGLSAAGNTEWATAKTSIPKTGNFKFVFVSGSFDATGGKVTGAQLYVDNIQTSPASVPLSPNLFDGLVSYTRVAEDKAGIVRFDLNGKLEADLERLSFKSPYGTNSNISINLNGSTQSSNPYSVMSIVHDGVPEGKFSDLTIEANGLITANFSNGNRNALGRIVLANFTSATGLTQVGNSRFLESTDSGRANFGAPGSGVLGSIKSGALEKSNVNLTDEMVDLIAAQRNFQANAKAIETITAMTKSIINNIS